MANIGHGKTRPIYVAIASIVSNYAVYITILLFEKKKSVGPFEKNCKVLKSQGKIAVKS